MNILVTGGAGYIGSHMVFRLIELGHQVTVIDDLSTGFLHSIHSKAIFEKCDIRDLEKTKKILAQQNIEAIFHFAGRVKVAESIENPLEYYSNNVFGTLQLLECCKQIPSIKYFLFSSTAAVYGNSSKSIITESEPCSPVHPYGRSKLMAEQIVIDYAKNYKNFSYTILRYFNVAGANYKAGLGPHHKEATHLIKVTAEVSTGQREHISIFGTDYPTPDGTCIRDFIHVSDLIEAHVNALDYLVKFNKSDIFNLGYGHGHSVQDVIKCMSKLSNKHFFVNKTSRRDGDQPIVIADSNKAKNILNWSPQWDDLDKICDSAIKWEQIKAERAEI